MRKRFNYVCAFMGCFLLACGIFLNSEVCNNSQKVYANTNISTVNCGLNTILAEKNFTFSYQERSDDLVLEFAEDIEDGIKITYESLGNDSSEFVGYQKAFKNKYTSKTTIGKLIKINMYSITNQDGEEVLEPITSNIAVKVKIYIPSSIKNKNFYLVSCASTTAFRAIDERGFSTENNYIVLDTVIGPGLTIAVIYDKSYEVVIICGVVFVAILGLCIFLKIYKLHKDDPEYYAKVKKQKQQKKAQRKAIKDYDKKVVKKQKQQKSTK